MVIKKMGVVLIICFLLISCSVGMNSILGRTIDDPFPEIPVVQSFNGDYSINISWSKDEAADMYYLYRASDDLTPQYHLIYEGKQTKYQDIFSLPYDEKLYLYRLGKKRGQKLFVDLTTPGRTGLGVVSGTHIDSYEPNNSISQATELGIIELYSNCWLYMSNSRDGVCIYDEDWYYIDIPPRWKAVIILRDQNAIGSNNASHFKIETWLRGSREIASDSPIDISNPKDIPDRIFIRIYPDFSIFMVHHPIVSTGGYGAFIQYSIKISSLLPE